MNTVPYLRSRIRHFGHGQSLTGSAVLPYRINHRHRGKTCCALGLCGKCIHRKHMAPTGRHRPGPAAQSNIDS
jgi:hypothetical protein